MAKVPFEVAPGVLQVKAHPFVDEYADFQRFMGHATGVKPAA
jgi:hypothetical protein